jgi:hypothetical protein
MNVVNINLNYYNRYIPEKDAIMPQNYAAHNDKIEDVVKSVLLAVGKVISLGTDVTFPYSGIVGEILFDIKDIMYSPQVNGPMLKALSHRVVDTDYTNTLESLDKPRVSKGDFVALLVSDSDLSTAKKYFAKYFLIPNFTQETTISVDSDGKETNRGVLRYHLLFGFSNVSAIDTYEPFSEFVEYKKVFFDKNQILELAEQMNPEYTIDLI